jgi:hypothetical protein
MRILEQFSPIEIGETDNFCFDFTADVGAATIVSTAWSCALAPYQTATDSNPGSRILSVNATDTIQVRWADGRLETRTGAFSIASLGTFPDTALGGTYVLEAQVTLSDGRVLALNSTVQIPQANLEPLFD